jgi:hypothetical protein
MIVCIYGPRIIKIQGSAQQFIQVVPGKAKNNMARIRDTQEMSCEKEQLPEGAKGISCCWYVLLHVDPGLHDALNDDFHWGSFLL